jgi:hypothetical protein
MEKRNTEVARDIKSYAAARVREAVEAERDYWKRLFDIRTNETSGYQQALDECKTIEEARKIGERIHKANSARIEAAIQRKGE